jgi:hypothetical protein
VRVKGVELGGGEASALTEKLSAHDAEGVGDHQEFTTLQSSVKPCLAWYTNAGS